MKIDYDYYMDNFKKMLPVLSKPIKIIMEVRRSNHWEQLD